jgi:hypothetical protein
MAPDCTVKVTSTADPQAVYDLLANLDSHMEWNGRLQAKNFRLLSLSAEQTPASVGTVFVSSGTIPFSSRRWKDSSVVTAAEKPRLFEFQTDGEVHFGKGAGMKARFLHRYEIEQTSSGCRIIYTMKLESLTNGMWRISWPILRFLTWKMGIPMATRPGLRNLARLAEARTSGRDEAAATKQRTSA